MLIVMRPLTLVILLVGLAVPTLAYAAPGNGNGPANSNGVGPGNNNGVGPGNNNGAGPGNNNGVGPGNNNGVGPGNGNGVGPGNSNGNKPAAPANAAPEAPSALAPSPVGPSEQDLALGAVQSGQALPLSTIMKQAVSRWGGRVIDARLFKAGSRLVYRLTIVSDSGISQRVFLDAKTAIPLRVK